MCIDRFLHTLNVEKQFEKKQVRRIKSLYKYFIHRNTTTSSSKAMGVSGIRRNPGFRLAQFLPSPFAILSYKIYYIYTYIGIIVPEGCDSMKKKKQNKKIKEHCKNETRIIIGR
jgi:hypothetical protein